MFSDLNVFKTAHAMATHAGQRQAVISRNMANADTPGYQARDIAAFSTTFKAQTSPTQMQATRAGHLHGIGADSADWAEHVTDARSDPNGNSVSIEEQMLNSVEVKRQHDRAVAIYRSSLALLRTSLGKV